MSDEAKLKPKPKSIKIDQLFKLMVENGSSDLHVSAGSQPTIRVHGSMVRVKVPALTAEDSKNLLYQVLTDSQKHTLEKNLELDFSFEVKNLARFRANIFYTREGLSGAFRYIPEQVPKFENLEMPEVLLDMANVPNGVVLVTGPTGSGKSTTLASLLDYLNCREPSHIVTLEDPIEFIHKDQMSLINQREIGFSTLSFKRSIKSLLRQDPDIVLIGEMRDPETIESALTIAETGHLVFGTLHTNSAVQTINRIINVFPASQQDQIRTLLSFVLKGVVSQQLLPKSNEPGRVCALEVLRPNPAIANLIREDKIHQIYSQIQVGQDQSGMMTMNQSLEELVNKKVITRDTAMEYSTMPEELAGKLGIQLK